LLHLAPGHQQQNSVLIPLSFFLKKSHPEESGIKPDFPLTTELTCYCAVQCQSLGGQRTLDGITGCVCFLTQSDILRESVADCSVYQPHLY
jgi:hypothetical protein